MMNDTMHPNKAISVNIRTRRFGVVYAFVIREIFKLNSIPFCPKVSINSIQMNKNILETFLEQYVVY